MEWDSNLRSVKFEATALPRRPESLPETELVWMKRDNNYHRGKVIVAQWSERLPQTSMDLGSNPTIDKFIKEHLFTV